MKLEDLVLYEKALAFGDAVWDETINWDSFCKWTIGNQIAKSADSVSANIAEGYGRYYFKENRLFCFYARGSVYETKNWLIKAKRRKLIEAAKADELLGKAEELVRILNGYIKSLRVPER